MAEGNCTHFTKRVTEAQKRKGSGLPWWSSGLDSTLPARGAGVLSLVGTLGSHMPYGAGKKKKKRGKHLLRCIQVGNGGTWAGLGCWFPGLTPHRPQALSGMGGPRPVLDLHFGEAEGRATWDLDRSRAPYLFSNLPELSFHPFLTGSTLPVSDSGPQFANL